MTANVDPFNQVWLKIIKESRERQFAFPFCLSSLSDLPGMLIANTTAQKEKDFYREPLAGHKRSREPCSSKTDGYFSQKRAEARVRAQRIEE